MAKETNTEAIEEAIQTEEQAKNIENNNNYFFVRKLNKWTLFRSFAIIFLVIAILTLIAIILMKYLNLYFNFGPMEENLKDEYKDAKWWEPFTKWSWSLFPDFQNKIENVGSNTVVVVEGITWAGTNMAVAREAIIINNIANGGLYIALPTLLIITITLTLLHFLLGRKQIIALMAAWTITATHPPKSTNKVVSDSKSKTTTAPSKKPVVKKEKEKKKAKAKK